MKWPSITHQNRWVFFFGTYFYIMLLYMLTNHQHYFPSHHLRLTIIDMRTPFLPWTGWIYVSVYFLPLVTGVVVKRDDDVRRVIISFLALSTLATCVFFVFPTVYPRPPMTSEGWLSFPLNAVRSLDTPKNCFPSQHVALAFLSAFFVKRYRAHWGTVAIIIAILISISTLTTKQHYVWDVLVGYFLARITYWLATGGHWLPSTIDVQD